jgi:Ni/Fe-hydrogenase subunit HybB-like protein
VKRIFDGCTAEFGEITTWSAAAGVVAGIAAVVAGLATGNGRLVFGVLASNWLFFGGLSAGGIALSAAIRVGQGRWAAGLTPVAEAMSSFFLPSILLLGVLVLGSPS